MGATIEVSHVNGGMRPAGFVLSEATYLLFARTEDEIGTINQCRVNTNFNQMAKIQRLTLLSTRCDIQDRSSDPITVHPTLNGVELSMELDTGATLSVISKKNLPAVMVRGKCSRAPELKPTESRLKTYTGEAIRIVGEIIVDISLNYTN